MINTSAVHPRGYVVLLLALCATLPAATGRGEIATWGQPDIDTWLYSNAITSGAREFAPSFGGLSVDTQSNQFQTGSASAPTRLGMAMIAFDTHGQIESGKSPSRYQINSVTVTAWGTKTGTGVLSYSEQAYTPASLLADAIDGGLSSQQPVELFGLGFTGGYDGLDLGPNPSSQPFAESTEPYGGPGDTYLVYPVAGDGMGGYQDVSNNLSGGYSATAAGNQTPVFDAPAWSVGKGTGTTADGVTITPASFSEGETLPSLTQFTFSLDLSQPGVVEYVQQSLAYGALGFTISSVHPASQPGTSSGPEGYIDWRMTEAFADLSATLKIDYTLTSLPGDYDADGDVDAADYAKWRETFGASVPEPGTAADGNQNGVVDAGDYTVWRDNLPPVSSANAAPEPSAGMLMVAASLAMAALSGNRTRTSFL